MKIIVKKLQGGECTIEVEPDTNIFEIKKKVYNQLKVPIEKQKLLFLGRALADDQTVSSYPIIREGSKLNLVVKKPETLHEVAFRSFKEAGISDLEAKKSSDKLLTGIETNLNKMSWDDVERIASGCLQERLFKIAPQMYKKGC